MRHIVLEWRGRGSIEGVLDSYPTLTKEEVEEALAYYDAHRDEIEEDIRANDEDD